MPCGCSYKITALVNSGAQSCLWSLKEVEAAGFTKNDLIPVSPILIEGDVLIRLEGKAQKKMRHSCATMVYISIIKLVASINRWRT